MNFWTIFAAVMAANLLTVMFAAGLIAIVRREDRGERVPSWLVGCLLMPMLFAFAAFMIATDTVPDWLNAL